MKCRAEGKWGGRAATVDSCAQGHGGAGLGGRLKQQRGSGQWSHKRVALTTVARLMVAQA